MVMLGYITHITPSGMFIQVGNKTNVRAPVGLNKM